jgi:hypothetical protein
LRFLAGALTGAAGLALVVLHIFAGYEDVLFDRIVAAKVESGWTDEKKVAVLTNAAHELVKYRAEIFTNLPPSGLRERWLRSAEVDLMTGRGACGSFTSVLARLLDRAGIGSAWRRCTARRAAGAVTSSSRRMSADDGSPPTRSTTWCSRPGRKTLANDGMNSEH